MSNDYFAKKISLREDEEIILVLHHHPITFWKQILLTAFLILLAFFLMFFLLSLGPIGVALFLALLLTGVSYGLREFYIWYFNVFIITNQRIFDLDQKGFFNKTVSELSLEKILDICYSVQGFWQTILKLGTIKIQAASVKLMIKNVRQVVQVNQLLADLIREQTGKQIEVKKVKQLNAKEKEQLTEDFLKQDELAEYEDYNLQELIEDYKETFGDLKLKKLLVDELEKYEKEEASFASASAEATADRKASEAEEEEAEEQDEDEESELNNFKKRQL